MILWHERVNIFKPGFREAFREIQTYVSQRYSEKDIDSITNRFSPLGCRPQFAFDEIYPLLAYVIDGVFQMDLLPEYKSSGKKKIRVPWKSHNETIVHHYLKEEATRWLQEQHRVKRVWYEEAYQAGIADVVSSDRRWFIECGASRPSKVWHFFSKGGESGRAIVLFNRNGTSIFKEGPRFSEFKASLEASHQAFVEELNSAKRLKGLPI